MTTDPSLAKDALHEAEEHMVKSAHALELDLRAIRTGRANPMIVERVMVNYYDTPTPLANLATIAAPEPQLLTIRPFDVHSIKDIERAILASDLGLTPNNDGKLIRLVVPRYGEEPAETGIVRVPGRPIPGDREDRLVGWRAMHRAVLDAAQDCDLIHIQTSQARTLF